MNNGLSKISVALHLKYFWVAIPCDAKNAFAKCPLQLMKSALKMLISNQESTKSILCPGTPKV